MIAQRETAQRIALRNRMGYARVDQEGALDHEEKYPLLRGMTRMLRVYGYGCFIAAAVSFLWILFGMESSDLLEGLSIVAAVSTAAMFVGQGFLMLLLSEIPTVFMDTEQNTRALLSRFEDDARERRAAASAPTGPPTTATAPPAAVKKVADLSARMPKVPPPSS